MNDLTSELGAMLDEFHLTETTDAKVEQALKIANTLLALRQQPHLVEDCETGTVYAFHTVFEAKDFARDLIANQKRSDDASIWYTPGCNMKSRMIRILDVQEYWEQGQK